MFRFQKEDLEWRLQQLAKSEFALKLRILELEKHEAINRCVYQWQCRMTFGCLITLFAVIEFQMS